MSGISRSSMGTKSSAPSWVTTTSTGGDWPARSRIAASVVTPRITRVDARLLPET